MLRCHMLRCYCALLADAAQQVKQRPSRRNVEVADEVLFEVVEHLRHLGVAAVHLSSWDARGRGRDASQGILGTLSDRVRTKNRFRHSLAEEVAEAGLLDSWASCYLHLLASGEWGRSRATELLRRFTCAVARDGVYLNLLSPLASSPLSVLLTAHVVRLVSLHDGGTSYGLPDELAAAVPVWSARDGAPVRSSGNDEMSLDLLRPVLALWTAAAAKMKMVDAATQVDWEEVRAGGAAAAAAEPPPAPATATLPPAHASATLDICIRVLNAAANAGASPAAASERPPHHNQSSNRMVPERRDCGHWAHAALTLASDALPGALSRGRRPVGQRPEDAKRLRAFWGAYVRALGAALDATWGEAALGAAAGGAEHNMLRPWEVFSGGWQLFVICTIPDPEPEVQNAAGYVPERLGPHAEAAVAAGAIPIMERLVRRRMVHAVPLLSGSAPWTQLLMHGPMGHLAALITAVAKCVADAAARAERSPPAAVRSCAGCLPGVAPAKGAAADGPGPGGLIEAVMTGSKFLDLLLRWSRLTALVTPVLTPGREPSEAAAAAAAAGLSTGGRQLVSLSFFAAMKLLPPLSRALRLLAAAAFTAASAAQPAGCLACRHVLYKSVEVVLRCSAMPLQPSPTRPPPAEQAAAAAVAGQWRQLLLRDIDLLGLLGAAATLLLTCGESDNGHADSCGVAFATVLGWACHALPRELLSALSRLPASDGSSGGAVPPALTVAAAALNLSIVDQLLGPGCPFEDKEALSEVRLLLQGQTREAVPCAEMAAIEVLLPPPDELRMLMAAHCCANPACANLEGPSEASLPRRRCGGGCGGRVWWYCSRECQVAHWRAGHKAECEAAGVAGPGAGPSVSQRAGEAAACGVCDA